MIVRFQRSVDYYGEHSADYMPCEKQVNGLAGFRSLVKELKAYMKSLPGSNKHLSVWIWKPDVFVEGEGWCENGTHGLFYEF